MWDQFKVIGWAQYRSLRNRLPRTNFGAAVMVALMGLWYLFWAGLSGVAGFAFSTLPTSTVARALPILLLGAMLFWQWLPILTMAGGWSLQFKKLQAFPISGNTLFWIESGLRLTSAPEMVLITLGVALGLMRNPALTTWGALLILLYVPLNLFLTLAIRETLLVSFHRSRFRELLSVSLVVVAVLPQFLMRTAAGEALKPLAKLILNASWTPWQLFTNVALDRHMAQSLLGAIAWTALIGVIARFQFGRALLNEETPRSDASQNAKRHPLMDGMVALANLCRDPVGALVEREIRSLLRMPRFRVIFGMACVLGLLAFFPMAFGKDAPGMSWVRENFLSVVDLYGLLLMADSLVWNAFGFDRGAAQFWFLNAPGLRLALAAKNVAAIIFIGLQNLLVLVITLSFRLQLTAFNVVSAILASVVMTLYFLAIGNLSSVTIPRAVDPSQTMRKQAGGKLQLWLLASTVGMVALVGFAYFARWAFGADWAAEAVFGLEFVIGIVVYRVAMDSAVARGMRDRERILELLAKDTAPVSM